MDKPNSIVNKLIYEEDKVYNARLNITIKQMKVVSNSTGPLIDPIITYELIFDPVAFVTEPFTITMKKNPDKFDGLINESIAFNNAKDWQKEIDYK